MLKLRTQLKNIKASAKKVEEQMPEYQIRKQNAATVCSSSTILESSFNHDKESNVFNVQVEKVPPVSAKNCFSTNFFLKTEF